MAFHTFMRLHLFLYSTFLSYINPTLSPSVPALKVSEQLQVSNLPWNHNQTTMRRFD